jgi:hypothetical protein
MDLDLDIGNYSIKDLEKFFRLKSDYDISDIEYNEVKMREILLKTGHVKKEYKVDLIEFLTKAKEWLIFVKCGSVKKPTTLPVEPRLDKTEYKEVDINRENELISKTHAPYVNTFASDYHVGSLNPLVTRTIKRCLTIDTRFRDNFYNTQSSDFTFQLPLKLNKVVSMQMSSLEIPIAFYGISHHYGNSHIWIEIEYDDISGVRHTTSRIFRIEDGNYNAVDFIAVLNNEICPKNTDGSLVEPENMFSYIGFTLNITQTGSGNGKVTIAPSGAKSNQIARIKLDFSRDINGNVENTDISSKIGWNLGFTRRTYDGDTMYVADTIVEPATIRYIYLAVDDFNNSSNNHFITAFNQSILNPNILARISLRGNYFGILMENDLNILTEPRKYFGPVDIQRLRIRLYDDFGRILNMNNANYSFCLVFTILYDI